MRSHFALASVLLTAGVGCRALPDVPRGECGNRVVEAPEDCDVFSSSNGAVCRQPGSAGECHFDCSPVEGQPATCPPGFGCDPSYVCHRATGGFEQVGSPIPGAVETLDSGDFDGDGRADIVGLERAGALGATRLKLHYFDAQGAPAAEWTSTLLLAKPTVAEVSPGDHRSDLLLAGHAIAVLLGEPTRVLTPDVRPTYYLRGADVRIASVLNDLVEGGSPLLALVDQDGSFVLKRPIEGQSLLTLCDLPGSIATLAGRPVVGPLFEGDDEHPCWELLLVQTGASAVSTYQACRRNDAGEIRYRDEALVTERHFEPPAKVAGPPLLADLDGDGHLDVLAASDRGLYAAFGDGHALGALEPFELDVPEVPDHDLPAPLVGGDFTGDGIADFVTPVALLVSDLGASGHITYHEAQVAIGGSWSEAVVGDFNGDGRLDAMAASKEHPDLDWFAGTGTLRPNPFVIPTVHPTRHLTVGDLDGDLIDDVAFVEHDESSQTEDRMSIAFGGSEASLDAFSDVGHLADELDLTVSVDNDNDLVAGLIVANASTDADGGSGTALSLLEGTSQRNFLSYIQLTTFSSDESIEEAYALVATTGHFIATDQLDAAIVARTPNSDGNAWLYALWLLPDLASHGSTTLKLGWAFDERLVPSFTHAETLATIRAGDLDGDGADEVVMAAPNDDGTHCLVGTARVDAVARRTTAGATVDLELPCPPRPFLALEDVDDDGAKDLILNTADARLDGSIIVLFNDGNGSFEAKDALVAVAEREKPRAFAPYRLTPDAPLRLAVISDTSVRLLESRGRARGFSDLGSVASMRRGTGITAADVNGDGILDLAVADSGNIEILKASLLGP